jgi:hypothetical protein
MDTFLQLNACISVLGWLESEEFQARYSEIIQDAESPTPSSFTMPSVHYLLLEINPETSSIKQFTKHRKTAVSFRDSHLFPLLKIAYSKFKDANNSPVAETSILIIKSALGFDFLGYQSDQDNHGMSSSTQIPSSWRDFIYEEDPIKLLIQGLNVYHNHRIAILECISLLMGCRRSLFSETERLNYCYRCCSHAIELVQLQLNEEEQTELLKILFRFCTVYSSDFKKADETVRFFSKIYEMTINLIENVI